MAVARRVSFAVRGGTIALVAAATSRAADPPPTWAPRTASPVPADPAPVAPIEQDALSRCGVSESGLRETARALLARWARGTAMADADGVALLQRAAGEPHPWARAWLASARGLDRDATARKLDAWLGVAPARAPASPLRGSLRTRAGRGRRRSPSSRSTSSPISTRCPSVRARGSGSRFVPTSACRRRVAKSSPSARAACRASCRRPSTGGPSRPALLPTVQVSSLFR